jgi:hypothetical protein
LDIQVNPKNTTFLFRIANLLFRGELDDPYNEFMISEDITITKEALSEDFNAQYWDNRYSLKMQHIPKIFHAHELKILNTGKYLNVIRDCLGDYALIMNSSSLNRKGRSGKQNRSSSSSEDESESDEDETEENPFESIFQFSAGNNNNNSNNNKNNNSYKMIDSQPFIISSSSKEDNPMKTFHLSITNQQQMNSLYQMIESAYQISSQMLLQLLMKGFSLQSHFETLGRFFLLEHGDFFIQFMDIAELDLRKEVTELPVHRLQHLLSLAIQTSTLANDPHRENVSCLLAKSNLIQHLHMIQVIIHLLLLNCFSFIA